MADFIPDKLFVSYKKENDGTILGFASPYEKSKAFEKRMDSQLRWSMGGYWLKEREFDTYKVDDDYNVAYFKEQKPVNINYPANIIDNVSISGFRIPECIRRVYWGGGNVVWRILDPRGFELEISSSNLARIMDCCVIVHGEILSECVWGRSGSQNILLPVTSDWYIEACKHTQQKENAKSYSIKQLKPGYLVDLINPSLIDIKLRYVGQYKCLGLHYGPDCPNLKHKIFGNKYIFHAYENDVYYALSTPKIANISECEVKCEDDYVNAINDRIKELRRAIITPNNDFICMVIPSKTKFNDDSDIGIELVPQEMTEEFYNNRMNNKDYNYPLQYVIGKLKTGEYTYIVLSNGRYDRNEVVQRPLNKTNFKLLTDVGLSIVPGYQKNYGIVNKIEQYSNLTGYDFYLLKLNIGKYSVILNDWYYY